MAKKKFSKLQYYEVLVRCNTFSTMIEDYLATHPVISSNKKWVKDMEEVSFKIYNVWEEVANEYTKKFKK